MKALDVLRVGAVTPLGLSAAPTCAAFRAGLKALQNVYHRTFPAGAVTGARVPGSVRLRRTYADWLTSLATRSLAEAIQDFEGLDRTALILNLPEANRNHPALSAGFSDAILSALQQRVGFAFPVAESICGGRSGPLSAIARARNLLASKTVNFCCIIGVGSLVNDHDIARLQSQFRLKDEHRPMGVIPGEGAACFLLAPAGLHPQALARIAGVGIATSERGESSAPALRDALERALDDASVPESQVAFVVTDYTGERARAIDYMIAEMRTFRTIRASLPHWTFVTSAGDMCAAAGAMTIVLAATAHSKGYAPGALGVCVASSDDGCHAACVIQASSSARTGM